MRARFHCSVMFARRAEKPQELSDTALRIEGGCGIEDASARAVTRALLTHALRGPTTGSD